LVDFLVSAAKLEFAVGIASDMDTYIAAERFPSELIQQEVLFILIE
jgi:hypothetical protein